MTSYQLLAFVALFSFSCQAQVKKASHPIRLNQVGFYPHAPKMAAVLTDDALPFAVMSADLKTEFYKGTLSPSRASSFSSQKTRVADFSALTRAGTYVLTVPGLEPSYPFEIREKILDEVTKASIKSYYYQRMSTDLPERYAGLWKRKAGHPDRDVLVHPSAASANRPAGTSIAAPRGWYDAGDYNKYIVNSGITLGTLLSAYEDFPAYYNALALDIPERSNPLPDLLDECIWNLRWMLAMQDPSDGGVYHKLTNAAFDGMVMPDQATKPRYVIQKTTTATLDFAAVMAQSSRVFSKFEHVVPGLSDSCRVAAQHAWQWAQQHPGVLYDQQALNKLFEPAIATGAYGDRDASDEFFWAACELYVTTGDAQYRAMITIPPAQKLPVPSWNQVRALGCYSLIRFEKAFAGMPVEQSKQVVVALADELAANVPQQPYHTPMGGSARDFVWGSSAVAANQGIALIQAYAITGKKHYLDLALANADYLLGRNATGYSFVTGYGEKQVMHPHHRPSVADGVVPPVPGLLSGGPNPGMQDGCKGYPSTVPDEAFVDDACSYASNEVAINWNAPLVYLMGALEALQHKAGYTPAP